MHDVFRVFAGADEPIRQPEYCPFVLQVESGEGVRAPGPCLSNQGPWAPVPGARAHPITRMPLAGKTLRPGVLSPRATFRPISFSASCLFSKVHTAVRHVVDVATDHLA